MKKRIASVLVALVMVLSLVPKTSWAWTSTVTTLEQLKSAMSELSYNNTIEIVVSGTIEISETLNIRPTRTTNGSMAWYEYYNQRVVISGADANSKLVRAEGFKGSLFNLTGEQGYSGAGGSDHPAYAALTLKDITVDGGGDKTTATNPAIYVSRYGTLTLEDGTVQNYAEPVNERYLREMAYFLDYAQSGAGPSVNTPETALDVLKLTLGEL